MKNEERYRAFLKSQAQSLQSDRWFVRRVMNRLPMRKKASARRMEIVLWCAASLAGLVINGWWCRSVMSCPEFWGAVNMTAGITAFAVWGILIYQLIKILRI